MAFLAHIVWYFLTHILVTFSLSVSAEMAKKKKIVFLADKGKNSEDKTKDAYIAVLDHVPSPSTLLIEDWRADMELKAVKRSIKAIETIITITFSIIKLWLPSVSDL